MSENAGRGHTMPEEPVRGKNYQWLLNGTPLYEARVRDVMGCWATVEVLRPLPGPHEHNYRPGQTFDIRVSSYTFREKT